MNWKYLVKRIGYWTIPPGIQTFALQQRRKLSGMAFSSAMQSEFVRNKKFHNIHKGQRCFILGSGPSINKQDLKPLKNEICFAVSMFFLHKDIKEINPLYQINAPNHTPFGFDIIQKIFDGFNKFYSDRTIYFIGHNSYEYSVFNFLDQNPQYKKDNIYYLNYSNSTQLDETNYDNPDVWDICKPLFEVRTAIYCAIQVAVYMGFRDIYLLGCDQNYLENISCGSSTHFYKDEEGISDLSIWPSTEEFFLGHHLLWKQYRLIRSYLEYRGCYIYNATEDSILDVFPRVRYSELMNL